MIGPLGRLLGVRILLDVQFWFPTWMIFLLEQGYTPMQAAAVDAVFHAVLVLAEVPMGHLMDRIGRKRALLATCALTVLVFAGIGLVSSVWLMAVVWGVWGMLWALASGLDSTYAWELAESRPEELSPSRYLGRTRLAGGLAGVVSLLSAGLLLEVWPPLPYLVTSGLGLIALLVAVTVPSVPVPAAHASAASPDSLRSSLRIPAVRTGIMLAAIVLTVGISIRILIQPLGLQMGLGAAAIGVGYGMIAVAVALGGWLATRLAPRRHARWIVFSIILMALSYVLVALTAHLGQAWLTLLIVLPVGTAAFGLGKTITDIWLIDAVGPRWRATVLSLASAANGLAMVGLRPVIVAAGDAAGHSTAFFGWGVLSGLCGLLCFVLLRRVPPRSASRKTSAPRSP